MFVFCTSVLADAMRTSYQHYQILFLKVAQTGVKIRLFAHGTSKYISVLTLTNTRHLKAF